MTALGPCVRGLFLFSLSLALPALLLSLLSLPSASFALSHTNSPSRPSSSPSKPPLFTNSRDKDVIAGLNRRRFARCPTPTPYPSYSEIVATGHSLSHDPARAFEARRCFLDALDLYLTRLGLYGQTPAEVARAVASPDAASAVEYAQKVLLESPQYSTLPAGLSRDPLLTDPVLKGAGDGASGGGGGIMVGDGEQDPAARASRLPSTSTFPTASDTNKSTAPNGGTVAGESGIVSPFAFKPGNGNVRGGPGNVRDRDSPDDPELHPDATAPYTPTYTIDDPAATAAAEAELSAAAAAEAAAVETEAEAGAGTGTQEQQQQQQQQRDASGLPSHAFLPTTTTTETTTATTTTTSTPTGTQLGSGSGDGGEPGYAMRPYFPSLADFGLAGAAGGGGVSPYPQSTGGIYGHGHGPSGRGGVVVVAVGKGAGAESKGGASWDGEQVPPVEGKGESVAYRASAHGAGASAGAGAGAGAGGAGASATEAEVAEAIAAAEQAAGRGWRSQPEAKWMADPALRARARTVYDLQLLIQQRALGRP